jgi:hypothetical protein
VKTDLRNGAKIVFILAIFVVVTSRAAQRNDGKAQVLVMDPNLSTAEFQDKDIVVHKSLAPDKPPSLPSAKNLDSTLKKVGASKYVRNWDQADKDMYALSVKTRSTDDVVKLYPKIPRAISMRLKTALN